MHERPATSCASPAPSPRAPLSQMESGRTLFVRGGPALSLPPPRPPLPKLLLSVSFFLLLLDFLEGGVSPLRSLRLRVGGRSRGPARWALKRPLRLARLPFGFASGVFLDLLLSPLRRRGSVWPPRRGPSL